jgi:uncharacterized Zn finger protein
VFYDWRPYVSVAERRRKAKREMRRLQKKGHAVLPVVIEGRTIARTFWGKAWCDNLERYSDFSNRLPRGRTYVRNGSVMHLQVEPGDVSALVSGSELYEVAVKVAPLPKALWISICGDCAGGIDSLVELLQGRLAKSVMERICQEKTGLFPRPAEIEFSCSCPDIASMCKHVAAVLYGIGARLDDRPELLFKLRKVDEKDLIAHADSGLPLSKTGPSADKVLAAEGLSELFGLELDASGEAASLSEETTSVGRAGPKSERGATRKAKGRAPRRAQPPTRDVAKKSRRPRGTARPRGRRRVSPER